MNIKLIFSLFAFFSNLILFSQNYREKEYTYFHGLPSDKVFYSFKAQNNLLYVATQRGTVFFDGYRFISIDGKKEGVNSYLYHNNEYYFEDGQALKKQSLASFSSQPKVIQKKNYYDSDPNNDHFENLFVDSSNRIWCSDFNAIKFILNGKVTSFLAFPNNKELRKDIRFVEITPNEIWISSSNGLFIWRKGQNQLEKIDALNSFSGIVKMDDSSVLLSTISGEILSMDVKSKQLKTLFKFPENTAIKGILKQGSELFAYSNTTIYTLKNNTLVKVHSLEKSSINHLYYDDKTQQFWVSTTKGLIQLIPPKKGIEIRTLVPHGDGEENPVISIVEVAPNEILALNKNGEVWRSKGEKWDLIFANSERWKCFSLDKTRLGLFLTTENGIYKLNDGTFQKLPLHDFSKSTSVRKVIVTPQNQLWILYANQMLKRYQLSDFKPILSNFKNDQAFWSENKWNDLLVDSLGKIWLAGWMPKGYGVCLYDAEKDVFVDISSKEFENKNEAFVGDYYNRIAQGKTATVLLTAFGGFNVADSKGKIIKTVTTHDFPIQDGYLTGISEDENRNIFFATAEGLHILLKDKNAVVHLNKTDGFPTNYLGNAYNVLHDGKIALGISDGFMLIDPKKVVQSQFTEHFIISQIMVNGKLRLFDGNTIRLDKNENNLTVYFSNLSFLENSKIHYFYRFEGDNTWIDLGNNPEISLNHIEPGNYTIQIKSVDHLLNEQKKQLQFHIAAEPPFLKSNLFKVLLLLLILALVYGIFRYKLSQKTREINYLQKIKEEEMRTLRAQMNPHFMFNTLNSINSYIIQNKTKDASKYLTSFSKLMRNILDNSKQQLIPLSKEIQTLKLYIELESARLEHSFDYSIKVDPDINAETLMMPPMLVQPFVENAIWHGVASRKEDGIVEVDFQLKSDGILEISVTDNGVGRRQSMDDKKNTNDTHQSYGVEITLDRLKLFGKDNTLELLDLYDDENCPLGTKVILKLKIEHDD